jgi:putative lipoic acid-binding regulatory protein
MDRDEALSLLRAHHVFPGPFEFRVVVRPDHKTSTVTAMTAAAGLGARVVDLGERRSRQGTYVALRVRIEVESAERVLDVYAILGEMPHVLAKL